MQKHYETELRELEWVAFYRLTRVLFYPVDVDSIDLVNLSRRSRLTRLRENSTDSIDFGV